ncbi:hypothetical protein OPT61_g6713 [Boeremia exigua]|uniref:Uncharacterized protein n=1 Tax=Boeremia exigua TaxID=749465 RepID=A0ACC2I501_9PLEO|nr:hypothetical protein OPT61_g6713 [Boeremia exigua]
MEGARRRLHCSLRMDLIKGTSACRGTQQRSDEPRRRRHHLRPARQLGEPGEVDLQKLCPPCVASLDHFADDDPGATLPQILRRSLTMAVPGCRGCARSTPRQRNHVGGADKGSSPIVAGARGEGQWGKAAGCSGTCLEADTSDCRRKSGNGKGADCVTKRGCPSEMTA